MIPTLLLGGLSLCHRDLGQNLGQVRFKGLEGVGESARTIPAHFHVGDVQVKTCFRDGERKMPGWGCVCVTWLLPSWETLGQTGFPLS